MRWCRIIFQFVFYLAGTFLHEAAHYLAALLIARPKGFSLVPRIEGDSVVFGSVQCAARYRAAFFFVGLAPLVWWYVLYKWLVQMGVVTTAAGGHGFFLDLSLLLKTLRSHFYWIWLIFQLLWAGKLSVMDIKAAALGLLSFSGMVIIALAVLILWGFPRTVLYR